MDRPPGWWSVVRAEVASIELRDSIDARRLRDRYGGPLDR